MESLHLTKLGAPRRFQSMEFHYDSEFPSNCTTPYVSAPSSPGRTASAAAAGGINSNNRNNSMYNGSGGFYFSAPTSPARSAAILSEFAKSTRAVVPFQWEEKPGIAKKNGEADEGFGGGGGDEFGFGEGNSIGNAADFEFSARFSLPDGGPDSEGLLCTADELFCNGQIRPLRLPPRLQQPAFDFGSFNVSAPQSPRSPRSPIKEGRRILKEAFSGLSKGGREKDFDPFAAALQETQKEDEAELRGRERAASESRRRRARSLSPLRIFHWEEPARKSDAEELFFSTEMQKGAVAEDEEVKSSIPAKPKSTRRWSLKDFLFRSASEGRAQGKDKLWGLSIAPAKQSEKHRGKPFFKSNDKNSAKRQSEDSKWCDVKSADGGSGKRQEDSKSFSANPRSGSFSKNGRKMPISPHELHYTANRAQSEELRKRTFLPYRQGLLGCLGFSSKGYTAMNGLARSLNTVS